MKKIIIVLLVLLATGCTSVDKDVVVYNDLILELNKVEQSSSNIPFDIEVVYEQLTSNEIRYQVIIDNPAKKINNIQAIVIHNKETQDIFPTSGIFDSKLNLLKDEIDVSKNNVKGILLVGYIKGSYNDVRFKVLVSYNKGETIYYIK